ncbi:MAG TPA: hypothetical protein VMM76_01205 [Pirellulaceae bacterium]|nr:hypothetical protein [Pirellulaceae bacterium]
MRFFIAGIMQGSHREAILHEQDYRAHLKALLEFHFPASDIYDPLAKHHRSLDYDDTVSRDVFYQHNRLCREVDVVVAFVPEASMGTAIEMWEAHEHGCGIVVAISPLSHNWAVRYCSHIIFLDIDAFEAELSSGILENRIERLLNEKRQSMKS